MPLSTLDQRFLDLMVRIEQTQKDQLAALTRRLEAAESKNRALEDRIVALEEMNARESVSLTSLTDSLERLLGQSGSPS
jgi:predicted  nucleic acid-binding Zn-ribbon protein